MEFKQEFEKHYNFKNSLGLVRFVSYAHIITILYNSFLFEYILKYKLFLWQQSWIFSIITLVFSVLQKSF